MVLPPLLRHSINSISAVNKVLLKCTQQDITFFSGRHLYFTYGSNTTSIRLQYEGVPYVQATYGLGFTYGPHTSKHIRQSYVNDCCKYLPSKNVFLPLMLSKKVGIRKISRIREYRAHTKSINRLQISQIQLHKTQYDLGCRNLHSI